MRLSTSFNRGVMWSAIALRAAAGLPVASASRMAICSFNAG